MRRVTPVALLLAAVFLTSAASSWMTSAGPGIVQPNTLPFWIAGFAALAVFAASESRKVRDRIPAWRSHASKLRRLEERGVRLSDKLRRHPVADGLTDLSDLRPSLITWGRDCQRFATDLDEPSYQVGLPDDGSLKAEDQTHLTFYLYPEDYVSTRLKKLEAYVDDAHKADRG